MTVGEALRHSYSGCHGRQGSGVRRELPGLRRQAALSGPLATGMFSLSLSEQGTPQVQIWGPPTRACPLPLLGSPQTRLRLSLSRVS